MKNKENNIKTKRIKIAVNILSIASLLLLVATFLYVADNYFGRSIDKPVLYLYPTEETNVTVNFANESLLTTTYPKFNNSWNVTVKPDGAIYDNSGKYYYALYWEEKGYAYNFNEGFYVTKDNAIEVLEETLSSIGLTQREANEFIMYWLPILEENEKSIISFETTESKQSNNELIIEPKPDSLLRITMHVKKVNKDPNLKEQTFKTFEREGFVAVEWGGQIH